MKKFKITIPAINIKQIVDEIAINDDFHINSLEAELSIKVSRIMQDIINYILSKDITIEGPLRSVTTKVDNRSTIVTKLTHAPLLSIYNKANAPSGDRYLFQTEAIGFGGKYHNWLTQLLLHESTIFDINPSSLIQMYELGLIEDDKISTKGIDTLNELRKSGPKSKGITNKVKTVCMLAKLSDNSIHNGEFSYIDWLKYKGYIDDFGFNCIANVTDVGKKYIEDNVEEAMESKFYKSNYWNYSMYLVPYLPIKLLPSYISSNDDNVRKAAQKRYDELKGV